MKMGSNSSVLIKWNFVYDFCSVITVWPFRQGYAGLCSKHWFFPSTCQQSSLFACSPLHGPPESYPPNYPLPLKQQRKQSWSRVKALSRAWTKVDKRTPQEREMNDAAPYEERGSCLPCPWIKKSGRSVSSQSAWFSPIESPFGANWELWESTSWRSCDVNTGTTSKNPLERFMQKLFRDSNAWLLEQLLIEWWWEAWSYFEICLFPPGALFGSQEWSTLTPGLAMRRAFLNCGSPSALLHMTWTV